MSNNGEEGHYDETPGATISAKGRGAMAWEDFQSELQNRRADLKDLLPADVPLARFIAVSVAAVKNKPDLLFADRRSLFNALTKAAQDGLLPDGREAVINVYNTKQKDGSYLKIAQYSPMTHGIRKRARELDNIIIDAQVVHKADSFKRTQGDDPKIVHEPADELPDRGPLTMAYAIFKKDGIILHREVMNSAQVEMVRGQSRDPDSLMWKKFPEEGWRKTVIRRGSKTVPVSEALDRLITRDDENFEFERHDAPRAALKPPPAPPPAPKLENKPTITLEVPKQPEPAPIVEETRSISQPVQEMGAEDAYADWLRDQYAELEACVSEPAVDDIRDRVAAELKVGDVAAWREACAAKAATVFQ